MHIKHMYAPNKTARQNKLVGAALCIQCSRADKAWEHANNKGLLSVVSGNAAERTHGCKVLVMISTKSEQLLVGFDDGKGMTVFFRDEGRLWAHTSECLPRGRKERGGGGWGDRRVWGERGRAQMLELQVRRGRRGGAGEGGGDVPKEKGLQWAPV